jgi:predicted cupin superfamily sugar epimerase
MPQWPPTLTTDAGNCARPQAVVPAFHGPSPSSLGAFALGGCTVAPGFGFCGFEIAPDGCSPG